MLELKVQGVRLRGCGLTLHPAAEENGVEADLMGFLLNVIYLKMLKMGFCTGDYDKDQAVEEANPNILDAITIEDLGEVFNSKGYGVAELVNNGLVTPDGNNLTLTKKAVAILKRASQIQDELDEKGFYVGPCHR